MLAVRQAVNTFPSQKRKLQSFIIPWVWIKSPRNFTSLQNDLNTDNLERNGVFFCRFAVITARLSATRFEQKHIDFDNIVLRPPAGIVNNQCLVCCWETLQFDWSCGLEIFNLALYWNNNPRNCYSEKNSKYYLIFNRRNERLERLDIKINSLYK